jgi:hypothetical protein
MSALNPDRPFVAYWYRPTGERVTKCYTHVEDFASAAEAVAAIAAPFKVATRLAEVRDFTETLTTPGKPSRLVATRRPKHPVRRA